MLKLDIQTRKAILHASFQSTLSYNHCNIHHTPTDTQAILHADEDTISVSFRGTSSYVDVLQDLKILKIKSWTGDNKYHGGFYECVKGVQDPIEYFLTTEKLKKDRPVIYTGHSAGGAMAAILALESHVPDYLITFGQPKVGGLETAKKLNALKNYYRVVNGSDAVVRLPFVPFKYAHGGDVLYISNDQELFLNPSSFFMFRDRLFTFRQRIGDHSSVHEYHKNLNFDKGVRCG